MYKRQPPHHLLTVWHYSPLNPQPFTPSIQSPRCVALPATSHLKPRLTCRHVSLPDSSHLTPCLVSPALFAFHHISVLVHYTPSCGRGRLLGLEIDTPVANAVIQAIQKVKSGATKEQMASVQVLLDSITSSEAWPRFTEVLEKNKVLHT